MSAPASNGRAGCFGMFRPETLRRASAAFFLAVVLLTTVWLAILLWTAAAPLPDWLELGFLPLGTACVAAIVASFVWIREEVERRRRSEEELRRLNRALETALARTQEADRVKSAFLATMSHELRTPLNSILGFAGVLLQELPGALNEEQRKQLTMVRDSARHLLALINDVLDLSKIEAGQLRIARTPYDVRAVVEHVVASVRPRAEARGLTLEVQMDPTVGRALGDARRLEQILLNLLANAVKFTQQGGVRVQVDLVENGTLLRFQVADTGPGIAREDFDKLFQPFQQLQTGLDRPHEGTGLGLAICRRLAGLLGGRIELESEPGRGSTFTVLLPLEVPEQPHPPNAKATPPP